MAIWVNGDRFYAKLMQRHYGIMTSLDSSALLHNTFRCFFTARNEVGGGNIFRSVCQEFCLQAGGGIPACLAGGIPACLAGLKEWGLYQLYQLCKGPIVK